MRRALGLLLTIALLLLAGCDSDDGSLPSGSAEASPSSDLSGSDPKVELEGEAEAEAEQGPRAPLTGLEVRDESVLERPVVALKVDNAPAARPQVGLEDADVVWTELVEGGTTRFIALYHAESPPLVGPVRSGREVDAELMPPFDPVFAISGAAPVVLDLLRGAGLVLREEGQPPQAWAREPSRYAPHNLFAVPSELAGEQTGLVAAQRPWPIDESGGEVDGEPVERVDLRFSTAYQAGWDWDGSQWLRRQDGQPHVTEDGGRLAVSNVVVARVRVVDGTRTDSAGYPVPEMDVVGEGDAQILMDGRVIDARWERSAGGHFSWTDPAGQPIALQPGRTWIELVPTSGAVETGPSAVG